MIRIRRILVALDASRSSLVAAEAAAELAARHEAELRGIFVEDTDLIRLSEAPLAREVDLLTGSLRPLQSDDLIRQFQAQANRARRALEQIAHHAGVECTFRVSRGGVAREILAEAAQADLVTLGCLGWSTRNRRLLGRTLKSLLSQGSHTLLLQHPGRIRPPIVVLYEGSSAGRDALQIGVTLTRSQNGTLRVLLIGEEQGRLEKEVRAETEGIPALQIEGQRTVHPQKVARLLSRHSGGFVIVPMGGCLTSAHLQALLETVACPLMTVS